MTPKARWAAMTSDPRWADPMSKGALNTDQKVQALEVEAMNRAIDARTKFEGEDYDFAMGTVDEWYRQQRAQLERHRAATDAYVLRGKPTPVDELVAASKRLAAGTSQAMGGIDTALGIGLHKATDALDIQDAEWDQRLKAQDEGARKEFVEVPDALIDSIDPRIRDRQGKIGQIVDATLQSAPQLAATIAITKGAGALGGARLAAVAPFLYTFAAEGADAYHEALSKLTEQGMALDEAEAQAVKAWAEKGAIGGVLEAATPVMFLQHMDKATGGALRKTLAAKLATGGGAILRDSIVEGVTEFLQESWGQSVARRYFIDPKLSQEEREALITQWKIAREVSAASGSLTGALLGAVETAAGVKGKIHVSRNQKGKLQADLGGITQLENRLDLDAVARNGERITESFISDDPRFQAAETQAEAETVRQVIAFERTMAGQPDAEVEFRLHPEARTLADEIASGTLSEEDAYHRILNASEISGPITDPADVRVFGRNSVEFRDNVYRQVVDLYQGATPQDVAQEMAEVWFKTGIASGRLELGDFAALKQSYEAHTGESQQTDDLVGVTEWFSSRAVEYLTYKTQSGQNASQAAESFGAFLKSATQKPDAGTTGAARTFFQRARLSLAHTLKRARQLTQMLRSGTLDAGFEESLQAATGLSLANLQAPQSQSEAALSRATAPPPVKATKQAEADLLKAQEDINRTLDIRPPRDPGLTQTEQTMLKEVVDSLTPTERTTLKSLVDTPVENRAQFLKDNKVSDKVLHAFDALIPDDTQIQDELLRRVRAEEMAQYQTAGKARMYSLNEAIRAIGGLLTPAKARAAGEPLAGEMEQLQKESKKLPGRFRNTGRSYDEATQVLREYGFDFNDPRDLIEALARADAGQEVLGTRSTLAQEVTFSLANNRPLVPPVPHGRLQLAIQTAPTDTFTHEEATSLISKHTTPFERAWLGIASWLSQQQPAVSRADLASFLDGSRLEITDSAPVAPLATSRVITIHAPAAGVASTHAATLASATVVADRQTLRVSDVRPGGLQPVSDLVLHQRLLSYAASHGLSAVSVSTSDIAQPAALSGYLAALGGALTSDTSGQVTLSIGPEAAASAAGLMADPVPVTYSIRAADVVAALEDKITAAQVAASRRRLSKVKEGFDWRVNNVGYLSSSDRRQLQLDMRALEGIIAELPMPIRGKLGGFSALARLVRLETRQKYLLGRIDTAMKLLTDYERELHLTNIEELLTAAETKISGAERTATGALVGKGEGNRKERGKLGGEGHRLFGLVSDAVSMKPAAVEARMTDLEGMMGQDRPESELADIYDQYDILHHVGAIQSKTVDELARAESFLQHLFDTYRTRRRILEEARSARWQEAKIDLRNATGKPFASDNEVEEAKLRSKTNKAAQVDSWMTQKLDFVQFLERMFPNSTWARALGDRARAAVNQTTDRMLGHHRNYAAFAKQIFGVSANRDLNHRLADLMERKPESKVWYYERNGRTVSIPLEHAATIASRENDMGYSGYEAQVIAAAYEAHQAEGVRLTQEAHKAALDKKSKAKKAQAKAIPLPEERTNTITTVDFQAPVQLDAGSLAAGGFAPYPGKSTAVADATIASHFEELAATYEGSVGWQKAEDGSPRLYHKDGQAYALFLRHTPGAAEIDAVLFPVTLDGGFNPGGETRPGITPDSETTPAADPTSRALAGWKRRANLNVELPGTGRVQQNISQMEAAYDWLLLRQEAYAGRAEQLGFPPDAREQLEAFLLPETKALALYMQRELDRLYDHINPVYERINGSYLARNENYFPGIFETSRNQDAKADPFAPDHAMAALRDGFTKRRVLHSAKRKRVSAFHVFFGHLQAAEHYVAFAELAQDMKATMHDPAVTNSLVAAHGSDNEGALGNWIKLIDGGGSISAELHLAEYELFQWIAGNVAKASLAWKATTTLVQTSNIFATLADIPAGEWTAAATRLGFSGRLGQVWKEMWASPDIQRRLESGFSPEMKMLLSPTNPRRAGVLDELSDMGLDLINRTDAGALAVSGAIAYEWALGKATKAGMSPAAAKAKATAEASRIVNRVQQPTDFINKSLTENAKNPVMKMGLLMFLSDPRRKVANLYMAAHKATMDIKANPKAATVYAALKPVARLGLLYFALFPLWDSAFRGLAKLIFAGAKPEDAWDEKEILVNMATGPMNGAPILGVAWEMTARWALGADMWASRNPLLDNIISSGKLLTSDSKRVLNAMEEQDYLAAIAQVGKGLTHIGVATWGSLGALGNLIFQGAHAVRFADSFLPLSPEEKAQQMLEGLKADQDTLKKAAKKPPVKRDLTPIEKVLGDLDVGSKIKDSDEWVHTRRADAIKAYLETYVPKSEWAPTLTKWQALEVESGRKLISKDVRKQLEDKHGFTFPD